MVISILNKPISANRTNLSSKWRSIIASICIVSVCMQTGCAVLPPQLPAPPSEAMRAKFGTIGVVSAQFTPQPILQLPAKGGVAGAGRGAANWSATGALAPMGGGTGGDPFVALIELAASVVGATLGGLAGTVTGAFKAESAEKVMISETALKDAISTLKLPESLRDRFMRVAQSETREHFVVLPNQGPKSLEEKNGYGFLAKNGIDTVVEVAVTNFGVNGPWDVNPPLGLVMKLRIRVIRTADDKELYTSELEYKWGERTFCEWAADNARPFLTELDRSYQIVSEKVVEELFLLYLPDVVEH